MKIQTSSIVGGCCCHPHVVITPSNKAEGVIFCEKLLHVLQKFSWILLCYSSVVPSTTEEKILDLATVIHHNSCTLGNILVIEKTSMILCSHPLSFSRNSLSVYKLSMLLNHFIRIFLLVDGPELHHYILKGN